MSPETNAWKQGDPDRREIPRPEGYEADSAQIATHVDRALDPKKGRFIDPEDGSLKENPLTTTFDKDGDPVKQAILGKMVTEGAKAAVPSGSETGSPETGDSKIHSLNIRIPGKSLEGADSKFMTDILTRTVPNLRKAFKNAGLVFPNDSEMDKILMTHFNPKKVEAMRRHIELHGLGVTGISLQDAIKLIDSNKKTGQLDTDVGRRTEFLRQEAELRAKGFLGKMRFGVGEMKQEKENLQGYLQDIFSNWQQSETGQETQLPDHLFYSTLQAQSPVIMDRGGWSMLSMATDNKNIVCPDGRVSRGRGDRNWLGARQVDFDDYDPNDRCYRARARSVVMENS